MLIRKVNIWIITCKIQHNGITHLNWSFLFYKNLQKKKLVMSQQNNHPGSELRITKWLDVLLESSCSWEFVICPLHIPPSLSDSHLASGLDTRARDWMVRKEWGKAGSVSLGKGQGLRPFENTCQGLAHTLCIFWMRVCSLLSAIWPHLHIKQRAEWPNARFDTKQRQWFTGHIPSSDPASTFVRRFHFLDSQPINNKTEIILNHT